MSAFYAPVQGIHLNDRINQQLKDAAGYFENMFDLHSSVAAFVEPKLGSDTLAVM